MEQQPNTTEQILNTLLFKIEAIPKETVVLSKSTNSTPINVKIRVSQTGKDGASQMKILSLPKLHRRHKVPDRIRLVNSDQTIMSFNIVMKNEPDQKSPKTLRKQMFHIFKSGGCLKAQDEINEYSYKPTTSKKGNNIIQLQQAISNQNLKSNTSEVTGKEVSILGRCKPGGCLDPPFNEDKYVFQPTTKYVTSELNEIQKNVPEIKISSPSTQKIRKNEGVNISASKLKITKRESQIGSLISGQNIEYIQTKLKSSFSNAIITYPLVSSSTEFHKEISEKDIKKIPFTETNQGYFLPPKKNYPAVKESPVSNKSDSNTSDQEIENNSTHATFDSSNISNSQQNIFLKNIESNLKTKVLDQIVDSPVKMLIATNTQAINDNDTNFTQTPVSNSVIENKGLLPSGTHLERKNLDNSVEQIITEINSFHKLKLRNMQNDLFPSENSFNTSSIDPNDKTHRTSHLSLLCEAGTENNIKQFQKLVLHPNDQNHDSNHTNITSYFSKDKISDQQVQKENSLTINFDPMCNKLETPAIDAVNSINSESDYKSFKNILIDNVNQVNEDMKEEYPPKTTILLDVPSITAPANLLTADRIQKNNERQTFHNDSNINKATKPTSEKLPQQVVNNNEVIDSERQKKQNEQMLIENVAEDIKIHKTVLNKDNELDVVNEIKSKKIFCKKNGEYEANGDGKVCEISSTNNVNAVLKQLSATEIIGDDERHSEKGISKESIVSAERSLIDESNKSSNLLNNFKGKNLTGSTEYLIDNIKYEDSKKIESPLVSNFVNIEPNLQSDVDFLVDDDIKNTYDINSSSVTSEKNPPVQANKKFSETLNLDSNYSSSEFFSDPGNHNKYKENKNEEESIIRNINLLEIGPLSVAGEISTNESFEQDNATLKQSTNNTNKADTETVSHCDISMIPEVTANSDSNHVINSDGILLHPSVFINQDQSKRNKVVSREEFIKEANEKIILRKDNSIHSRISTERNENESNIVTNSDIIKTDNMLFTSSPVITIESLTRNKSYEKLISPIQSEFKTAEVISTGIIDKHFNVNTLNSEYENSKISTEFSFNKFTTSKTSITENEEKINQLIKGSKNINSETDTVMKLKLVIPSDISKKSSLVSNVEQMQFQKDSYSKKVISTQIDTINTKTDTTEIIRENSKVCSVNVASFHVLKYDNTNTTDNEIKIDDIPLDNLEAPNNPITLNEERVSHGLEFDISNNLNNKKSSTLFSNEKIIKDSINEFKNSSMKHSKDSIDVDKSTFVGSNKHSRVSSLNSEYNYSTNTKRKSLNELTNEKIIENKENTNHLIVNSENINIEPDILAKPTDVANNMFNEASIHNIPNDEEVDFIKETYNKQDNTKIKDITLSEFLNKSFDDNKETIENDYNIKQKNFATKHDGFIVSNDTIVIKEENFFNISTENRNFEPEVPNQSILEKSSTPLSMEKREKKPISEEKNSPVTISKDSSVLSTNKTHLMELNIANPELSSINAKLNSQNIKSQEDNNNMNVKEDLSYMKKDASQCLSKDEASVKYEEVYSKTSMDIKYKELSGVQKGDKNILKNDVDVQTSNVFNNPPKSVLSRSLFTKIDIVPNSYDNDMEYIETIKLVNPIPLNKVHLGTLSLSEESDNSSCDQVLNSQNMPINESDHPNNKNLKRASVCDNKFEKSSESTFVHSFVYSLNGNETNNMKLDEPLKAISKPTQNEEVILVPGQKNSKDIEKVQWNPPDIKNNEMPFNLTNHIVSLDKKQKIIYSRNGSVSKQLKKPFRIPQGFLDSIRFSVAPPENQGGNDIVIYSKQKQNVINTNNNNDEINFANLLNNIYEKELIPLKNIMKDLQDNVDELAKRNEMYREFSAKDRRKPKRLIQTNKKCGCIKKTF